MIDRARALVAPSAFIAAAIAELFPDLGTEQKVCVIENEAASAERIARVGGEPRARVRVSFVGQFVPSKGSALFREIATRLANDERFAFRVVGEIVDHASLRSARRSVRVETTGRYRRQALPRLLDRGLDIVVFASVVPESWSYTLTEVLASGTPVIALDLGAVGQRLRRIGRQAWLAGQNEGAEGFVRRLRDHVEGRLEWPAEPVERPWSTGQMAGRHADLYRECLRGHSGLPSELSAGAPG